MIEMFGFFVDIPLLLLGIVCFISTALLVITFFGGVAFGIPVAAPICIVLVAISALSQAVLARNSGMVYHFPWHDSCEYMVNNYPKEPSKRISLIPELMEKYDTCREYYWATLEYERTGKDLLRIACDVPPPGSAFESKVKFLKKEQQDCFDYLDDGLPMKNMGGADSSDYARGHALMASKAYHNAVTYYINKYDYMRENLVKEGVRFDHIRPYRGDDYEPKSAEFVVLRLDGPMNRADPEEIKKHKDVKLGKL